MKIQVKLFALAKEICQREMVEVEVPEGGTLGYLRHRLAGQIPALSPLIGHILLALNAEYAPDDFPLSEGDEVACIPPVSGG
jgi:sulfur-carrier protein